MFCINCGEKLIDKAKFCHMCGFAIKNRVSENRKQEFVGKVLKCSNCGSVLNETIAVCPDCGMRITCKSAVYSVRKFNEELMVIEATRERSNFEDVYSQSANPADMQKLSLIRSFPIPNTIDDIQEFILLAVANIDTKLSKQTSTSRLSNLINSGNINLSMQKTISDAWVSKMQQVFKKAEISFPNDSAFIFIKDMYYDKLKELKIKI